MLFAITAFCSFPSSISRLYTQMFDRSHAPASPPLS